MKFRKGLNEIQRDLEDERKTNSLGKKRKKKEVLWVQS